MITSLEFEKIVAADHLQELVNYARLAWVIVNIKRQGFPHDPNCEVHVGRRCTCFKEEFDKRAKWLKGELREER